MSQSSAFGQAMGEVVDATVFGLGKVLAVPQTTFDEVSKDLKLMTVNDAKQFEPADGRTSALHGQCFLDRIMFPAFSVFFSKRQVKCLGRQSQINVLLRKLRMVSRSLKRCS